MKILIGEEVKYTVNGKEYSGLNINKRCAELLGFVIKRYRSTSGHGNSNWLYYMNKGGEQKILFNPCNNPSDTWPIIEKCWDELMFGRSDCLTEWNHLITKHNCTNLIAACICFIESSEVAS